MTQFETELIRAIEYGCPCGSEDLVLYCTEQQGYYLGTDDEGSYLHYEPLSSFIDSEDNDLECRDCATSLWTKENGWIPELQEIVKGG